MASSRKSRPATLYASKRTAQIVSSQYARRWPEKVYAIVNPTEGEYLDHAVVEAKAKARRAARVAARGGQPIRVTRSAITGRFVNQRFAKRNPSTTIVQRVKR